MELLRQIIDLFLHLDKHLNGVIQDYQMWTYAILFVIVFCETGLVVTPFLPGDSLLFAAGALAASGPPLEVRWLLLTLIVAAVLGDTVNYWIGHLFGERLAQRFPRVVKPEYLARTHKFYEKYGGETIILCRFVPIVRTFAPFVAGVGTMSYRKFFAYNVLGGILWVVMFIYAGYWFGGLKFVKENFGLVELGIIVISVLPMVIEFVRFRRDSRREAA
jgi:membrane-associated protein